MSGNTLIEIVIQTLLSFSYLSLATLGIVLIFKTSTTTNFAQGMIGILGAYTTSYLIDKEGIIEFTGRPSVVISSPFQLILPILGGMLASFLFGFFIDAFVFRKSKYTNPATKQIISMGFVIILTGLIPAVFDGSIRRASFGFSTDTVNVLGVNTSIHGLVTLGLTAIIMTSIFLSLKYSKWGLGVRSVASNERVAGLMGVNTNMINSLSWAIAGALGALSAITFTASINTLNVGSMTNMQIYAFYSSILGGFQTFHGPLLGSLIFSFLNSSIPTILVKLNIAKWGNVVLYLSVMVIVLFKPNGLFGKKIVKKV